MSSILRRGRASAKERSDRPALDNDSDWSKAIRELDEGFPSYRFGDLKAVKIDPAHHIAGTGFIKRGAATLLIGGTGSGKSVLCEQIAACVACGKDVLGKIPVPRPAKVLYIEAENDEEVLKEDFMAIAETMRLPLDKLERNLLIRHVPGMPSGLIGDFLDLNMRKFRPDLLILDPYQSYLGASDINSTEPFFRWRDQVERAIKKHGVGLLLAAHTPKPTNRDNWTMREYVYMAAGTSAISNWARTSCELLEIKGESNRYQLHFSKQAKRAGMTNGNGEVVRSLYVEWSSEKDKPCWLLSENQSGPVRLAAKKTVLKIVEAHPDWSQRQVAAESKLSLSTVNEHYPRKRGKKK